MLSVTVVCLQTNAKTKQKQTKSIVHMPHKQQGYVIVAYGYTFHYYPIQNMVQ